MSKKYFSCDDVLCEVCDMLCQTPPEDCELEGGPHACGDYLRFLRMPTADVRPVVRSEWVTEVCENSRFSCYCRECGTGIKNAQTGQFVDISAAKFCPWCGAIME